MHAFRNANPPISAIAIALGNLARGVESAEAISLTVVFILHLLNVGEKLAREAPGQARRSANVHRA